MNPSLLLMILLSIALSASSQLLLKIGMSSAVVQGALGQGLVPVLVAVVTKTPFVIVGLLCFGLSAIVWLFVLSRLNVSYAYPFVALGIVLTVGAGHLLLGESISLIQLAGTAAIVGGVVVLTLGR